LECFRIKPYFLDTQSQWFTHRGVRAPRALAGEALLHLEEEVAGDVAGEELGVGGGHLESLGDVDGGADDHVVGLLLEGVVGVGNAVVVDDAEQRVQRPVVELLVVVRPVGGLVEAIGPQHGHGAVHDLDELLVGGEVLEALGRVAHLGAMVVVQVGLQAVDQVPLLLAQVDGPGHAQQPDDHRVGHVRFIGSPGLEQVAVALVLLLLGAQGAHWETASLAAHESRVGQHLQAHTARIQGVLLVGGQSDQQRAVPEDDLAPLQAPGGHHPASRDLRHSDLPGGILVLERGQVQIQQLRGAFRADHLG